MRDPLNEDEALVLEEDEELESLEPDEDLFGMGELFRVTTEGANE